MQKTLREKKKTHGKEREKRKEISSEGSI